MFKKILAIALLAISASFATWDYYPVPEAGKGSAEGGLYYDKHNSWSQAGLNLGVRYVVVQNLEISLQNWGYQFWSEVDCDGCANGGDGLRDLTLGARYQLDPMINMFLDLNIPLGGDEVSSDEFSIYLGGQFSLPTNVPGFAFGTEGGILWGFEHDNWERGLELHIAGELKYTVPNVGVTPYVGMKIKTRITESTWEGCAWGDDDKHEGACKETEFGDDSAGDMQFILWLGASYAIDPMIEVKAHFILRSGDHDEMGGDATGIYAAGVFNF